MEHRAGRTGRAGAAMSDLGQTEPILLTPFSGPPVGFAAALDACPAMGAGTEAISLDPKELPIGGPCDGYAALSRASMPR